MSTIKSESIYSTCTCPVLTLLYEKCICSTGIWVTPFHEHTEFSKVAAVVRRVCGGWIITGECLIQTMCWTLLSVLKQKGKCVKKSQTWTKFYLLLRCWLIFNEWKKYKIISHFPFHSINRIFVKYSGLILFKKFWFNVNVYL